MTHRFEPRDDRGKVRAACSCGWEALGRDSAAIGAVEAWRAHLYARGFRTIADVRRGRPG